MVASSPRPTFPIGHILLGIIFSVGILFFWEFINAGVQGLHPIFIMPALAGILGFGLAFDQLRYSLMTLVLVSSININFHTVSWISSGLIPLVAFVLLSFVWGMVFGRPFLTIREQRNKDTPWWVYFLLILGLPGVLVRSLLETMAGRVSERPISSSVSSSVKSAPLAGSGLYLLTLLVEGGCALVRTALLYLPTLLALIPLHILFLLLIRHNYYGPVQGLFGPTNEYGTNYGQWIVEGGGYILIYTLLITVLAGFGPVVLSLFHALLPFGRSGAGTTEIESLGAREPTRAEHTTIIDTLQVIQTRSGSTIAAPSHWRIIDDPAPDAYTIGSTIYLARGAVESPQLAGLIAHELGHIAHKDGDLLLSLRRFIIPVAYYVGIDRHPMPAGTVISGGSGVRQRLIRSEDEKIYYRFQTLQIKFWLAFWFGGMGLLLLGQHWARFWRQRDFLADDYTVALGFDQQLMELLQLYRHVDVAQPFLLSNRPYTAERLDRLQG